MKLLHVTDTKNVNSIIKNGLLPSHVEHDGHWEIFQRYLMQRNCVYLWDAETYGNEKFIRDMIYCKMFIHPRNKFFKQREVEIEENGLDYWDDDLYPDFRKFGSALVGDSTSYSVLEIDQRDVEVHGGWRHVQEPCSNKNSTTTVMDDKYAHDDKNIYVSGSSINFNSIAIVEEVQVRKYKNNKLGFTFRKN